jgi:hypothetical protein
MTKYLINSNLDKVHKKLDELYQGLESCTDPFLRYNIIDSISILSDQHTSLSERLNLIYESNSTRK